MKTKRAFLNVACALFLLGSLPSEAATYLVDRLSDADPAGGGEGSGLAGDLRFCLTHAGTGDVIGFSVVGTIELITALPVVTHGVTIQGPGANLLTVQGAGGSVLVVDSGANVTFAGLAITGGVGNGGGIFNLGTLTLNTVTVHGNTAGDPTNGGGTGAGIWNGVGATLTLNGTTVSGNSAIGNLSYNPSRGGGIANYGTMTLINSTVSGNSASQGFGGGISNSLPTSTLTLTNSTVSANSSPGTASGGLDNVGTLIAGNSIVAGNENGDLSGDVASEGYNLFGTTDGSGFDPTDLLGVDPLLGPLQDNGGATSTMSPLPGSPAIDHIPGGSSFPATDQRNVSRPQGPSADSGAVEVGGAPGLQVASIVPRSGAASGGTPVTITGTNFQFGATMTIGGVPATGVVFVDSGTLNAVTGAHAAGTVDVVVTNPTNEFGTLVNGYTYVLLNPMDFNGDGKTDLVWRNGSTGENVVWLMNGTAPTSVNGLITVSDTNWEIVGAGDFNGDESADLLWRNRVNGLNALWLMNGTAFSSIVSLPAVTDTSWRIVATGDFNGDGQRDIVWRNGVSGLSGIWLMNGTAAATVVSLPTVTDTTWTIAGAGDFNGDGLSDLVWRNIGSGLNGIWLMNGTSVSSVVGLPTVDPSWLLTAVGDFNEDGNADLVWRSLSSGSAGIWLMNGTTASSVVPTVADPNWRIAAPR